MRECLWRLAAVASDRISFIPSIHMDMIIFAWEDFCSCSWTQCDSELKSLGILFRSLVGDSKYFIIKSCRDLGWRIKGWNFLGPKYSWEKCHFSVVNGCTEICNSTWLSLYSAYRLLAFRASTFVIDIWVGQPYYNMNQRAYAFKVSPFITGVVWTSIIFQSTGLTL